MKSDGMTKKCMMYSLDAVTAIFTVLFKGKAGEAYNASNSDNFITVKELQPIYLKYLIPKLKLFLLKMKLRHQMDFYHIELQYKIVAN